MGDLDLSTMFDEVFRGGPPAALIDPTVRAGRSALRRRRILTAVGTTACMLAIATVGFLQSDRNPEALPGPARLPTPSQLVPAEVALTMAAQVDKSWRRDCGQSGQP